MWYEPNRTHVQGTTAHSERIVLKCPSKKEAEYLPLDKNCSLGKRSINWKTVSLAAIEYSKDDR